MTTEKVRVHVTAVDGKLSDTAATKLITKLWLDVNGDGLIMEGRDARTAQFLVPASRLERFAEHAATLKITITTQEPT